MPSLTLKNIEKSFGDRKVLSSFSATINTGEYLILMGASGCGKSTLLRIIAGLEKSESGQVFFGETDITHLSPQERKVSFVFQNYALWPHLKVKDNIGFSLDVRKIKGQEKEKKIQHIAALTQITEELNKYPDELSGGQQQRVSLARGLVYSPSLLLLDEPLSNLDPSLRESMRSELKRIQKELGLTTIHVTHDRDEALTLADRIAIIDKGKLVQIGTPEEVYYTPVSHYVGTLLGECNCIHGIALNESSVRTSIGDFITERHMFTGKVSLLIRPKALLFNREQGNTLTLQIKHQDYFGDQYKFTAMQHDIEITGYSPRKISTPTITISILPEHITVVKREI